MSLFYIKTLKDNYFVCNKETGKWILTSTKNISKEALQYLSLPFLKLPYISTKLLVLNITTKCNFKCIYCHIKNEKEENMDIEIGKIAVDKAMAFDKKIKIVFHGSEPLMNFPFIEKLVEYGRKRYPDLEFCIQTNGSLLTKEIANFLTNKNIGVGISLDGNEESQNIQRLYKSGQPTYSQVIKNIKKLNQETGVITVVTKYNVDSLEKIVENYEELEIREVLFSPLVAADENIQEYLPSPKDLLKNMTLVMENYLKKIKEGKQKIKIINTKHLFGNLLSKKLTDTCLKCGTNNVHPLLAIDIDGDIYPCDYFWGKKEWKIGNIVNDSLEGIINSQKNFRVSRNIDKEKECSECDWKRFCGGGCMGELLNLRRNKSFYCEYYKGLFEWAAQRIDILYESRILQQILI
jgi:uncharacterized protein